MPDTRPSGAGRVQFGLATQFLHRPVQLLAQSPDPEGRRIRVLDTALDASYFVAFGILDRLELTVVAPARLYQTGAGAGAIISQTAPPIERNAVGNPRLGLGYTLNPTLGRGAIGLRLGLVASLPLGEPDAFAGERSWVVQPDVTFGWRLAALQLSAAAGVRLRSAVEFGGTRLGNQAFFALGASFELIPYGALAVSLEAFGLPALTDARASNAAPELDSAHLFPAEWFTAVHSSFGSDGVYTLSLGAGSGLPLSSETRAEGGTSHFLGVTTPDFRSALVLRIAPAASD